MTPLIDVCSFCSARCGYCLHQVMGLAPREFMDESVFRRIAQILKQDGFRRAHLYMSGEPFYHPRIYDFTEFMCQLGIVSNIATKLPRPLEIKRLKTILQTSSVPISFELTIDSLIQEHQTQIAPGLKTNIILENLEQLAHLRHNQPKLLVICRTIVNAVNIGQLKNIAFHVSSRGIPWTPKAMGYYMARKADSSALSKIDKLAIHSGPFASRFKIQDGTVKSLIHACPFHEPAISTKGDVTICCHDMLFEQVVGNIINSGSLKTLMASARYKNVRNLGNRMKLPICIGCN